jgi:hypothetical protein
VARRHVFANVSMTCRDSASVPAGTVHSGFDQPLALHEQMHMIGAFISGARGYD